MQGLMPCPFCGRDSAGVVVYHMADGDFGAVSCARCRARGPLVRLGDPSMADADEARAMDMWDARRREHDDEEEHDDGDGSMAMKRSMEQERRRLEEICGMPAEMLCGELLALPGYAPGWQTAWRITASLVMKRPVAGGNAGQVRSLKGFKAAQCRVVHAMGLLVREGLAESREGSNNRTSYRIAPTGAAGDDAEEGLRCACRRAG